MYINKQELNVFVNIFFWLILHSDLNPLSSLSHSTLVQSITLQRLKPTHLLSKPHSIPLCSSYHKTKQGNQTKQTKKKQSIWKWQQQKQNLYFDLYKVFDTMASCWHLSPNSIFFWTYIAVPLVLSQLTRFKLSTTN